MTSLHVLYEALPNYHLNDNQKMLAAYKVAVFVQSGKAFKLTQWLALITSHLARL